MTYGDYGESVGWYGSGPMTPEEHRMAKTAWEGDSGLQDQFGGDYNADMSYQKNMRNRQKAGLEDFDVYRKAIELDTLRRRGKRSGGMSEWEKKLRGEYKTSRERLMARAQMAGKNRAAVSRAFASSMDGRGREFEGAVQEMRLEESKIAGDALAGLLRTARTSGAQEAAAQAEMLQQWQRTKENETLDLIASVVSGAAALGTGLILL